MSPTCILVMQPRRSYRQFTSVPYSTTGCSTVTDVSVVASAPVRIDIMTSPVNVHAIPKRRAGKERGDRSPYLLTNAQTNKYQ